MLDLLGSLISPVGSILAAVLFFVVALVVAELVKNFVVKFLKKMKLDEKLKKFGVEEEKSMKYIESFGTMVYLIVMLLILPSVFDVLGMNSVSDPIVSMLRSVFAFIPKIFASFVILVAGVAISEVAASALKILLVTVGTDKFLEKNGMKTTISISGLLSAIVKWVIIIIAIVEAANALELSVLTKLGNVIVSYIPYVVSASLILVAAFIIATLVEKKMNEVGCSCVKSVKVVKIVIMVIGVFMALNQLQIAPELVNSLFVICVAAVALAFAISFGIGGRNFAENLLERLEKKLFGSDEEKSK